MKLKNPLITYTIVSVISSVIAYLMFQLGGSVAEVTGNSENLYGVGFKASGLIGGFIIIFHISQRMIIKFSHIEDQISNRQINLKVYLKGVPDSFIRGTNYVCQYTLFDETSGETTKGTSNHRWEAGYLTIDIPNVKDDDLITIIVSNSETSKTWKCDYFYPRAPQKELELI